MRPTVKASVNSMTMSSSPLHLLRWPRRAFCNRTTALDHGLGQRVWGEAESASQADVLEKQRSGRAQGRGTAVTLAGL